VEIYDEEINMEMQQLDDFSLKARHMLDFLSFIAGVDTTSVDTLNTFNTDITTISGNMDQILADIQASAFDDATSIINSVKSLIASDIELIATTLEGVTPVNDQIVAATAIVNELIPMIQAAKVAIIGDGTVEINYKCSACSIGCKQPLRFEISDTEKHRCRQDGSNVANFVEINRTTYTD
jgi:hypothetical protein